MFRTPRNAAIQTLSKAWATRRFIADRDLAGWLRLRTARPQTFSMVVAIYKVEDYLDDFARSVLRQRGGLKQLEVIFVNDGSPDRSGEIAKAWVARRPDVFRYIEQENQGVAAARNAGLRIATGDWVGFPDPDDFFSRNYLLEARIAAMRGGEKLAAITPNLIFYWEARHMFRDGHPLRYRFRKGRRTVPLAEMDRDIFNSASHLFLRRSIIDASGALFDPNIKPTFEDGSFVNNVLLSVEDGAIRFAPAAHYFYRRRADNSSAINNAADDRRWFTDQIRLGYLGLINNALSRWGYIPIYIQRIVLYEIMWRFRHVLNNANRASFLEDSEVEEFKALLHEAFEHISCDTINEFELAGCTEEYKVAILGHYKSTTRVAQRVYVKDLDEVKSLVQLAHYDVPGYERDITVRVNGKVADKLFPSGRSADLLGDVFFRERRFWVRAEPADLIEITTAGAETTQIFARGGIFTEPASRETLFTPRPGPTGIAALRYRMRRIKARGFGLARTVLLGNRSLLQNARRKLKLMAVRRYAQSDAARNLYGDCWLLMDRGDRADDNAEHLYRYLMKTGQTDRAYFVVEAGSPDWDRLSAEGFRLLDYRSREHIAALINARFLISSHADNTVLWPEERKHIGDLTHYRYVFLQHGVTTNDLSGWLNHKPIHLFITAMPSEYDGIADPAGQYLVSEKETVLTGFARHDRLLEMAAKPSIILITPTWRQNLIGAAAPGSYERDKVDEFSDSLYARSWSGLLNDPRLAEAARQHGLQIVFCPHPNMMIYVPDFGVPEHVRVVEPSKEGGYQPLLAKAAVLINDYSSVASEVAYLNRPVVYYQFDEGEIFSGGHTYGKGPFDFRRDGFGPVTTAHDATVDAIIAAISGDEDPVYAERRMQAFPHRDGRCCARIHQAILALDDPAADALPSRPNAPTLPDRENALPEAG